jgi:hypothetical protein
MDDLSTLAADLDEIDAALARMDTRSAGPPADPEASEVTP